VWTTLETEKKVIEADLTVRGKAIAHGGEVNRSVVLVYLDRVSTAKSDMGAAFTRKVSKDALAADATACPGLVGRDLRALAGPEVIGE
jgi:hypothetical protein